MFTSDLFQKPVTFTKAFIKNVQDAPIELIAAGVAFYFLLAVFPALAAAVSMYGLFSDPVIIANQFETLEEFLPPESLSILTNQAYALVQSNNTTLSLSLLVSLLLAVYSATKGVNALIKGFNIAYKVQERRGFFKLWVTTYGLTFVMLLYFLGSLTVVAGIPVLLKFLPFDEFTKYIALMVRWPLLFTLAYVGLEILYRFGPARVDAKWRFLSFGSLAATTLWVVASTGFSFFVRTMGNYNETYGSLGAVVVLLLWFWISALMILLGAEINATVEGQRKKAAAKAD